jgi:putative membrane protein
MLQSRADLIVNACFFVTLLAPVFATASIPMARQGRYESHRRIQTWLLGVCYVAVLALEIRIRLAGGSGRLLAGSPYAGTTLLATIATVHIGGAVATYLLWGWLLFASRKAFRKTLPGAFARSHRLCGWLIILGLWFTAVSASAVYYFAFVAGPQAQPDSAI